MKTEQAAVSFVPTKWLGCLGILLTAMASVLAEGQKFDRLDAGAQTFTNAVIVNVTSNDVFVSHGGGFANVKVQDLPPEVREKLGLVVEAEAEAEPSLSERLGGGSNLVAWQAELAQRLRDALARHGRGLAYGILGGLAVVYLFFCYCCRSICRRANQEPGLLVWLPVLQKIPLLKAAEMSRAWLVPWIFPLTSWIGWIAWSFAIAKARNRSPLFGVLLLLPVTNIIAFLNLAFSDARPKPASAETAALPGQLVLR